MKTYSRRSVSGRVFDVFNHLILMLWGVVTLGPFLYLVAGSLTDAGVYRTQGVTLNPLEWTLESYRFLLGGSSRIFRSMGISVFITVVGTVLSLLVTAGLAYGLSKSYLPGRGILVFFVFFTMLFSGGMVPFYLVTRWCGLINSPWSLVIPFLVNVWYTFVVIKFFQSLPQELEDAARIDGCSEIGVFLRVVLPLSKPVLATIGLFYAVGYWNQWFWAMIFIWDDKLHPLQLVLRGILSEMLPVIDPSAQMEMLSSLQTQALPPVQVVRMGAIVVTVLPIAIVYPFLQRHFAKGVMIGSLKG